jgi:hypothetical protein
MDFRERRSDSGLSLNFFEGIDQGRQLTMTVLLLSPSGSVFSHPRGTHMKT